MLMQYWCNPNCTRIDENLLPGQSASYIASNFGTPKFNHIPLSSFCLSRRERQAPRRLQIWVAHSTAQYSQIFLSLNSLSARCAR